MSAPTPFLTGRKHTLFYNDEVFEKGSVGLALSVQPAVEVAYDVEPIKGPHTIAASVVSDCNELTPDRAETCCCASRRATETRPKRSLSP